MSLLTASQIRMRYGALEVLRGVDLSVAPGETFAIIGPNGAGKTTMFKVLTGETMDFSGTVTFEGKDVSRQPSHQRVWNGFGRTFQVARVFAELSVLTNVIVAVENRRASRGEPRGAWWDWRPAPDVETEAMAMLRSMGLERRADDDAALLSHGDKKRLEFALTIAGDPRILMLDEPTAGMSTDDKRKTVQLLMELKAKGMTIVLTEHDMSVVFGLADRVMVLNYGEVVCVGTPENVRNDEAVKRVYLGKGMAAAHA